MQVMIILPIISMFCSWRRQPGCMQIACIPLHTRTIINLLHRVLNLDCNRINLEMNITFHVWVLCSSQLTCKEYKSEADELKTDGSASISSALVERVQVSIGAAFMLCILLTAARARSGNISVWADFLSVSLCFFSSFFESRIHWKILWRKSINCKIYFKWS
jgi:hypothetical protein